MTLLLLLACAPEPTPADVPDCVAGELADGDVCVPEACGTGAFGDLADIAGTLYVDGSGATDGAYTTIQEALDAVTAPALVAVAAGTYAEGLVLGDAQQGVTLAGRCTQLVTVDGTGLDAAVTVTGSSLVPQLMIEGLGIEGGGDGVAVTDAEVELRGVSVSYAESVGVKADTGSTVTVSSSVVELGGGMGVEAQYGAALRVSDSSIRYNTSAGLAAFNPGTTVEIEDTTISDTSSSESGQYGFGIYVDSGATLDATGCTLERNRDTGFHVQGEGTVATMEDSTIADTMPDAQGNYGFGVAVAGSEGAARATVTATTISRTTRTGAGAALEGATLELVDSTVSGTLAPDDGTYGYGVDAQDGGVVTLTRTTVTASQGVGVQVNGAGATMTLTSSEVSGTTLGPDGTGGAGAFVWGGGYLESSESTFVDNVGDGVLVADAGSFAALASTIVSETAADAGGHGAGVAAQEAGAVDLQGCSLERNAETGLYATGAGTTITATDTLVSGTVRARGTAFAIGVHSQIGASITGEDLQVNDVEGPGIYAVLAGTVSCVDCTLSGNAWAGALVAGGGGLDLVGASIDGTVPDAEAGGGFGVYAIGGDQPPVVAFTDSVVGPMPYAAVWLDGAGSYDIERSTLYGGPGVAVGSASIHGNALFAENGIVAWDGATGLQFLDNTVQDAASDGVLLDGSTGLLSGTTWSGNGTDLRQQRCDGVTALDAAALDPAVTAICPEANVLTAYDLTFTTLYLPEASTAEP